MIQRSILAAAALALAALAAPAPAQTGGENWRQIHSQGDVTFAIDLNSIKTIGNLRHFRVRATQANGAKVGYYDNAADCAAKTVDTLYAEIKGTDGSMRKQAFKPGEARNTLDDADGKLLYPIICG
jgi:hypothetical protein